MKPLRPLTIMLLTMALLVLLIFAFQQEIRLQPSSTTSIDRSQPSDKINILTADRLTLTSLPGIGHRLAQRMITYRQKEKITDLNQLLNVKGIGPTLLTRMKPYLTLEVETERAKGDRRWR